jgi:hypothetical protein
MKKQNPKLKRKRKGSKIDFSGLYSSDFEPIRADAFGKSLRKAVVPPSKPKWRCFARRQLDISALRQHHEGAIQGRGKNLPLRTYLYGSDELLLAPGCRQAAGNLLVNRRPDFCFGDDFAHLSQALRLL